MAERPCARRMCGDTVEVGGAETDAGGLAGLFAIRVLARARSFCYSLGAFGKADGLFRGSSAVEQPAVNRLVAGSNPARGAISSKSRVARACHPAAQSTKPPSRSLRPPPRCELAPPHPRAISALPRRACADRAVLSASCRQCLRQNIAKAPAANNRDPSPEENAFFIAH